MRLKIFLIFTFFTSLISCSVKEYDGIKIPYSIHIRTDFLDTKVRKVIKSALNYESNAFKEFIELSNEVDGESGYDLGYVLTQVINRIGEDKFIELTKELTNNEKQLLKSFIRVGLEYGDNNYDGKMDNERIEKIYAKINQEL
ncbi:hypothetical protein [Faecalibacter sp. LW9]|uniref:hypothetical protein n=1 Tax=Faecalibacter sp. LW9 TaxID=3103144 RepID=UPI002AFFE5A8|nr:hypothetical protein [Faecalibacter sp. LW9]